MAHPNGGRKLHEIAHCRAGDKGDTSILMVRAFSQQDWELLQQSISEDAIASHFNVPPAHVTITAMPILRALSIAIESRLSGGVTRSPRADAHGKTLSGHLLDLRVSTDSQPEAPHLGINTSPEREAALFDSRLASGHD